MGAYATRVKGYVTLPELAQRLGLQSPGALRTQIARGVLHAVKEGRDWFVPDEEAERYAREHRGMRGKYQRKPDATPAPEPKEPTDA